MEWKEKPNRKPLIIRGARQIGKTYSIREFGNKYYKGQVHELNLEKYPELHGIFEQNFDIDRIIFELELVFNKKITPTKDLLFIDEIQECPKAILSLRYFLEQKPDLHVIAAGSLLEFELRDISFPVGRVQLMSMHPMNFYEFLLATGKGVLAEKLSQKPEKLPEPVHNLINNELRKYFIIGGMPECINTYTQTKSINEVQQVQSDLIATFRQDFSKYAANSNKNCLNSVLASVSQKIGQQIKYSQLADGFSGPTIKKAFELLKTARIFKKVRAASPAGIPIGASARENKFKAIFLDIGLLSRLSGISSAFEINNTNLSGLFQGAMAEQFVGQEILSANYDDIFYWARQAKSSNAEIDFLIEKNGVIIPIEVKSGAAGSLKSLHILLKTFKNIKEAYIFSNNQQYGSIREQKLTFFPLYFVFSALKK